MYTSGMVTSGPTNFDSAASLGFAFQYGYVEARARVPWGEGLWPAIWLLPANLDSQLEIDIVEVLGHDPSTVQMHYHYVDERGDYAGEGKSWTGPDFSQDWHVFALDWNPNYTAWYVDGIERWRAESPYLPGEPMYLVMNLAVGGDWPGSPTVDTPFPSTFDIDYVRVWERMNRE
jgi:beta-glucanase (GH16 family)